MWKRPSLTLLGRFMRRSKRVSLMYIMRQMASKSGLNTLPVVVGLPDLHLRVGKEVDAANAQLLRHLLLKQHFQSCEAVQAVSGMMAQIAFKEFGGDSTCKWVTQFMLKHSIKSTFL